MFDEEENNDFSAETVMGAILRKQRELPWIFGNRMEKEGITEDEPSTTTEDDIKKEIFKKIFGKEEFEEDTTEDGSSISTKDEETPEINDNQEKIFEEQKKSTTEDGSSIKERTLKSNIEEQEKHTTYSWPPTSLKETFTYRSRSQSKKSEKDFFIWSGERMKIFNQNKHSNLPRKKVVQKPMISDKPKNAIEKIEEDEPTNKKSLSISRNKGVSIPPLNGAENMKLKGEVY